MGVETARFWALIGIFTRKSHEKVGNNLVKVVVGQRRVGKSSVLRQVLSQIVAGGSRREHLYTSTRNFLNSPP